MNTKPCFQDVMRCHICETPVPSTHCLNCNVHLCKSCIGDHFAGECQEHRLVPFKMRGFPPQCPKHTKEVCDVYCEQCYMSICASCNLSGQHEEHKKDDIYTTVSKKMERMKKDVEELENIIYPKYQEAESKIPVQRVNASEQSMKYKEDLEKLRERLHRQIDTDINKSLERYESECQEHLNNRETIVKHTMHEILEVINDTKDRMSDFSHVLEYQSKNSDFREVLSNIEDPLPKPSPQNIKEKYELLGIITKDFGKSAVSIQEALCNQEKEIKYKPHKISEANEDVREHMRDTSDFGHVLEYKSRSSDSREIPSNIEYHLPNLTLLCNSEHFNEQFGSSANSGIITKDSGKSVNIHEALHNQEKEIKHKPHKISEANKDVREHVRDTSGFGHVLECKSKNSVSREVPSNKENYLQNLTTLCIREQFDKQFGSSASSNITEDPLKSVKTQHAELPCQTRPFLYSPRIDTFKKGLYGLLAVSSLSDSEVWTCYKNSSIILFNLEGKILTSVNTISGNFPNDITVTKTGDLVYTDPKDKSINIVNNQQLEEYRSHTKIETLIKLSDWSPYGVCCTSCGDLLITMCRSFDSKVVRYTGSTEKQTICCDDQGNRLYSFRVYNSHPFHLSENRNLDICVADWQGVVVVNACGRLRFKYTKSRFGFDGISTDSQGRILTSERNGHRVHILDQDGQFLQFLSDSDLFFPECLWVDSSDNLFVAERYTGKLKRIQYYQ